MSELKVYRFLGQDEVWPDANLGSDYYLKSEADKVIEKLNEKLDLYKRGWAENDKVNAYLCADSVTRSTSGA